VSWEGKKFLLLSTKKKSTNPIIPNVMATNVPIAKSIILDSESDGEVKWAKQAVNNVHAEVNQNSAEALDSAPLPVNE